jgi:flagellar hook assembly protein FlgD
VKNNPFMDFVVVEMTPNAKGDNLEVKGYISLYDNMGKLVLTDTIQNNPSVGNAVAWRWNGTNKSGRTVGTGTYLFKAFYTAKGASYDDKTSYKQAIGFVRGKK